MIASRPKTRWRVFGLVFLLLFLFASPVRAEEQVYYNVSNHKVHKLSCPWGQKCTKNCIIVPRTKAYREGGVACKVCGGKYIYHLFQK